MTPAVLPDSRLKDQSQGSVVMDWRLDDGSTVRLECAPLYCANCGLHTDLYAPRDSTVACFYLCDRCFEDHGPPPGTVVLSDHAFRVKVAAEIQERFGHPQTAEELGRALEAGGLGRPLELLLRETPYAEYHGG